MGGEGRQPDSPSAKRVHFDAGDLLSMPQVLGQEDAAAGADGGPDEEGIPEGELVETVKLDDGQDVLKPDQPEIQAREELDLPTCHLRGNAELPPGILGSGDKVASA